MPKSTRQTGNDFQDYIQKWLEEKGWVVHNQKTVSRAIPIKGKVVWVSQRQDIWGCLDLIAKKSGKFTLFIQATTHTGRGKKERDLMTVPWGDADEVQIWMKRDKGHIDMFHLDDAFEKFEEFGKIIRRKFYSKEGLGYEF